MTSRTRTQAAFLAGHCGAASSSASDAAGPRRALNQDTDAVKTAEGANSLKSDTLSSVCRLGLAVPPS